MTTILTDHESLRYLKTTKTSSKHLVHGVSEFTKYDLNIKYHKDSETVVSDVLSYRSDFIRKMPVNQAKKLWSILF